MFSLENKKKSHTDRNSVSMISEEFVQSCVLSKKFENIETGFIVIFQIVTDSSRFCQDILTSSLY